jgi:hypothetical protein
MGRSDRTGREIGWHLCLHNVSESFRSRPPPGKNCKMFSREIRNFGSVINIGMTHAVLVASSGRSLRATVAGKQSLDSRIQL